MRSVINVQSMVVEEMLKNLPWKVRRGISILLTFLHCYFYSLSLIKGCRCKISHEWVNIDNMNLKIMLIIFLHIWHALWAVIIWCLHIIILSAKKLTICKNFHVFETHWTLLLHWEFLWICRVRKKTFLIKVREEDKMWNPDCQHCHGKNFVKSYIFIISFFCRIFILFNCARCHVCFNFCCC